MAMVKLQIFRIGVRYLKRKVMGLLPSIDNIIKTIRNKKTEIKYNGFSYTFSTPNSMCLERVRSFSSKEPETLNWIDSFPEGSILWDIGANVGLYSIYAAKVRGCKVFSFEPSVFNLEVLARNIYLNDLGSLITIMPLAISDKMGSGDLSMSNESWGGALSTFDKTYGFDGKDLKVIFKYPIFSLSLDELISRLDFKYPDYIKIDVDGIEQLILTGGNEVLKKVKGVLIELPNLWQEQTDMCEQLLSKSGMVKIHKNDWHQSDNPNGSPNQIWARY
jgi:FkbM family methyltransferase